MTTPAPLTIVIPVHNRASIVCDTLDSVAAQTYRPLSIIVVDNNSSDNTRSVVERWSALNATDRNLDVLLLDEKRAGATAARNRGLAQVQTPWVMFFDSDDIMAPTHVENAVRAIEDADDEVDIVGWDINIELSDGRWHKGMYTTHDMLYNHLIHCVLSTQRYCVRTAFVRGAGGWDDTVPVWNDYELGVRLLCASPRAVKVDAAPTVSTYFTPESITGRTRDAVRCEWSLDRCADDLQRGGRADMLPWISYRLVVLAAECRRKGDRDAAARLLAKALMRRPPFERFMLRLCYWHNRLFRRGSHLIMRLYAPVR